jgi:dipeptidyl-peptidase-4
MFNKDLYPTVETFKYPKLERKNAVVSLHLFDVNTKTKKVDLGNIRFYIARMQWTKDPMYFRQGFKSSSR